ncbi:MAG TPA: glycosyltransferase family 39 protein [Candidatus Limnocylindrales bacterium]|nr:glycosyltransferase family 39 protein [Candidatus Limnocylindrales bacterium]
MRTPLLLYAFAFVVRLVLAALYPDPAYPDSYYYVDVGRALAAGQGFNLDFIWIFGEVGGRIPEVPVLPIPSNAHWLPLSSVIQAAFITVLGPTALASSLPLVVIGSLVAPLVWLIAREAGARPSVQIGAAILAAAPGAGAVFMPQPENFGILQPLVAATIYLVARGLKGHARSYAAAGLLVGLASLARNDGILLGFAVAVVFCADRLRSWRSRGVIQPVIPFAAAVGCFVLYLLVMAPWWSRQLAVFGSISPSSGNALWLRTMADWNSLTAEPSLSKYLALGLDQVARIHILGLVAAVGNFAVIIGSIVLVPFILVGAWARRHSRDFQPWFFYSVVVFLGAALIYPVHVPGGAFIHSAIGLSAHAYILALEGVVALVAWIARRRPGWEPRRAEPIFVGGIVVFVLALVPVYAGGVQRSWDASRQPRIALAAALDRLGVGPEERLFSIDAAGMKYWTGRGGVVTPDDPIETIEQVARAYHPRWLVLERNDAAVALGPVLRGESRPTWIGPPAFVVPGRDGGLPALALFPVCTEPGDDRCSDAPVLASP